MTKRTFRSPSATEPVTPSYPTLEQFDHRRREFLGRLAALGALLGAGALAAACGSRSVGVAPDQGTVPPRKADGGAVGPDGPVNQGRAPAPDARLDRTPPGPDANVIEGDVAGPDARIDLPDQGWRLGGEAPEMDAAIDPKP